MRGVLIVVLCLAGYRCVQGGGCPASQNPSGSWTAPPGGCNSVECVVYDISSQNTCRYVDSEKATNDARWKAGLNADVDVQILKGKIAAYKLQWFNGGWSDWYVPGKNDIDTKLNGCSMRRQWSYFFDHVHSYIICQ
ncbi:uncharacterized protein LOC129589670 [Paramacrobiotus metropolitanus]|uniref:uncharacterized protein LOC129589670 n=1 Tax=Paramacrobiotus metropolitanus TaxID=2943436 RepID=UPI00244604CD|nr:uncharacterized protein LOC129589670 [Paramacrobiotus metropolitanus]